MTECPVCGSYVGPAKPGEKVTHKGRTYNVCCERCRAKFEANPEKYAAKAATK